MTEDEATTPRARSRATRVVPGDSGGDVESWMGIGALDPTAVDLTEEQGADIGAPQSLRPDNFAEYIGQEAVKENIRIACSAALRRADALDHVLLHGPPGLGKTSLARIIARELNVGFKATSGPVIERPGDLAAILSSLQEKDVLFIDEIHRMPRVVEEVLYPALEDYQIDIMIGHGPAARSVKLDLKPFTLIAATTRTGLLTSPLRDRFGMIVRLDFYTPEQLQQIVIRSASILGIELGADAALEIGKRSRGTPRIANRLLKRVRDFAQERSTNGASLAATKRALELLDIDQQGLDLMDRRILEYMIDRCGGGPVGIDTIAAALGEERDTLEDVYEPYLVQQGMINRTRRGRTVSALGYAAVGRAAPSGAEEFRDGLAVTASELVTEKGDER